MAIEDDYGSPAPAKRSGPKAFTEYSFNAIMVMVGLVGSFMASIGGASYMFIIFLPLPSSIFGTLGIAGIIGLLMVPFGIGQVYFAWKIHSASFQSFGTILAISWIIIVLAVLSAIFAGFFFILTFQLVIGQVLLNALVLFFLSKSEVQQEFVWEQGGY